MPRRNLQRRGSGPSPILHIRVAPRTLRALEAKALEFETSVSDVARQILDSTLDVITYADTLPDNIDHGQVHRIAARIAKHAASRT
jgi:hypothetical protein